MTPSIDKDLRRAEGRGTILPSRFYGRSCFTVARDLLGCVLESRIEGQLVSGRIVETEPYIGAYDRASHAWPMKKTPRTRAMFGPGGRAYVFFVYGMHHQLCAVTGPEGCPDAVLIRALKPLEGIAVMKRRRGQLLKRLCDGPGKLCAALAVTSAHYGSDLSDPSSPLIVREGEPVNDQDVLAASRVGVAYAGIYGTVPWRMYVRDCPWVSVTDKNAVPYRSLPVSVFGPQNE
ncbi:MAG: 3-methyladenine DNA glycosylase [Dethiosulfovibrio peptidovorans]|nr:MAG: 3-methyladenine DNA glycosylase [Dethiosulfovibrio peptidovorans]